MYELSLVIAIDMTSPYAGQDPISDLARVDGVSGKLPVEHSVFQRRPEDHQSGGYEPGYQCPGRAEQQRCGSALHHGAEISRMPDEPVGPGYAYGLITLLLNAGDRNEIGVFDERPSDQGKTGCKQ